MRRNKYRTAFILAAIVIALFAWTLIGHRG